MSVSAQPQVSIVTPSLNQARFLREALESVQLQDYAAIEHIVVDGGSVDGSVEILEDMGDRIRWVSEPDAGQAHAVNKGFGMARGEILGWLNADDVYFPGALTRVVDFFRRKPNASFVYGDVEAIDINGSSYGLRANVGPGGSKELVEHGDFIVQPGAFWLSDLWNEAGPLDERLHYTLDYEFWMRTAKRFHLHYLPDPLAKERLHGDAKTFSGDLERIEELRAIAIRHGGTELATAFRGEAGAVWVRQGFRHLLSWRLRDGVRDIASGLKLSNSLLKTGLFLASWALLGDNVRARLWMNRAKAARRRRARREERLLSPSKP
ncbi:MAG: glycosyltransferase family 2 protein [Thermoanaerobaculia bacterium]